MGIRFVVAGALSGLVLGLVEPGAGWLGLLAGALVGWLFARQRALASRVAALEARLVAPVEAAPAPVAVPVEAPPEPEPAPEPEILGTTLVTPPLAAATALPDPLAWLKRWFAEGNVPVKVGMVVLFAGVGSLLKYATDEGWLHFPIELRLAGIAAAAIAALGFGFRERLERRIFALSLQGGAIGILVLTVFAAFRLYRLLPATLAFGLLLVLVAGAGLLAVLQDAITLAVLGSLAGFLAPILVSTGSGNHVALFTWYAILNGLIFAVAWAKAWRLLNLLGFVSTFAIATTWGVLRYETALFWSTEPFLLLFFAFYLAIPVLYGRRRQERGQALVDGALVFGNPVITIALQAALLEGELAPLALSALAIAAVHLALGSALWRREGMRVLGESYAALAVAFATLSVPLALSARTTAGVFAVEGAALIWLGLRQERRLPRYAGVALQVFAALAFAIGLTADNPDDLPLANGTFAGALLLVVGGAIAAWAYWRRDALRPAAAFFVAASFWWTVAGAREIEAFVPTAQEPDAGLAFVALTALLFAEIHRRLRLALPAGAAALAICASVPMLLAQLSEREQPFTPWGAAAWLAFGVLGWRALVSLREAPRAVVAIAHLGWLWAWPLACGFALLDLADRADLGHGWGAAVLALPVVAAQALVLRRPAWIGAPLGGRLDEYRSIVLASQSVVLSFAFFLGLWLPGDADPLTYLPLVNPLDLAGFAALASVTASLRGTWPRGHHVALAAGTLLLLTAATLRGVHHLAAIRWDVPLLFGAEAQTALSVVWSVLGVAAWVAGSRRRSRALWLAGAVLMGVVLAKLGLVDRQHLGNLTGIVSFLAYGVLCTVVGYLAPAPPRSRP